MRTDLTELVFILDRSGSMHGLEADTIGGFNRVLEENQKLPGDANVTTVLFSHDVTLLHDRLPIGAVKPITDADYHVGGSTALLDAVGMAITKIVNVQRSLTDEYRAGKVQFIIITDGMENASREYTYDRIRRMISLEREQYGWDFLFLGANIDAIDVASRMAIAPERAVTAMSDSAGVQLQYEAVCDATTELRLTPPDGARPTARWKARVESDQKRRGRR